MNDLRKQVSAVLAEHQYGSDHSGGPGWKCRSDDCSVDGVWDEEYDDHIADMLIAALGLTEEAAYLPCTDPSGYPSMCNQRRWVSSWSIAGEV